MSFGSPGFSRPPTAPTPPQRGSFPLDHEAECQHAMRAYLQCIRTGRGENSTECRELARLYLGCRMDHGLMARETWAGLGYAENSKDKESEGGQKNDAQGSENGAR